MRRASPVLRFSAMRARLLPLASLIVAALASPRAVLAAGSGGPSDVGRLVVFSNGEPVAIENFQWETHGDSLYVTSRTDRRLRGGDGAIKPWTKSMELIANAADMGLMYYVSTESFEGNKVNRTILPSDAAITVTTEKNGYGAADRLERLPGRLYVLDAGMFTLFDHRARRVAHRDEGHRAVGEDPPVQVAPDHDGRLVAHDGRDRDARRP